MWFLLMNRSSSMVFSLNPATNTDSPKLMEIVSLTPKSMLMIYFSHLCKVHWWFMVNVNYHQQRVDIWPRIGVGGRSYDLEGLLPVVLELMQDEGGLGDGRLVWHNSQQLHEKRSWTSSYPHQKLALAQCVSHWCKLLMRIGGQPGEKPCQWETCLA